MAVAHPQAQLNETEKMVAAAAGVLRVLLPVWAPEELERQDREITVRQECKTSHLVVVVAREERHQAAREGRAALGLLTLLPMPLAVAGGHSEQAT